MRSLALGPDSVTYEYNADGQNILAGAMNAYRSSITGLDDSTRLSAVGTAMAYDNLGSVVSRTVSGIVGGPFSNTYTRDSLGRITTATERFGSDSVRLDYGYDSAGRLATVNRNGAVEATYEYDPNGNRRLITTSSGIASAAFDAQDRQLSLGATTYSYDANGARSMRVVGADTTRYTYDVVGNLLRVDLPNGTRIDYIVDGQNRRIGKRVNGALVRGWVYQSQLAPIAELDASNQVIARFVYGALPTVPEYMVKNGITYRIISDHLGSVRLVVDVSTGIVAQRIDYDAFGREVGNTNPGFQPFGYAGGLVDEQTSLVRLGVRDYDPEAGRWTAKDPLLFFSNSTNLYAYVENDPINLVDPTGLQSLEDWANYAAGFGDFFTFGLTNWIRDKWDANDTIDRCSGWYIAGDATGFAMDIALGGAIGLEKAGAKAAGKEFSHWIPNRMGGPRSIFNGNFVTPYRHFLHDPYRYIKGWRDLGPRFPRWLQQLDRIPNIYKGLGAGAALGAVTEALRPCKCRN
jgi:RHS repeat-associated protein